MVETFRAIGYSLETAVADIIDNSISADAKNIWVDRFWRGGQSVITIKDDGHGMTSLETIQAMRPGSQNPNEERSEKDLGRFGLGLKTASFSQCRKVTVFSKRKDYAPAYWTWDLDYVAQNDTWDLLKWMPEDFASALDDVESGTIVIWKDMDRVVRPTVSESDLNAHEKFSRAMDRVKSHIAMTFHRFIESKSIKLYWCGHEIEPWNPFCPTESKIQVMPEDHLNGGVTVRGYILPHKKNFSSEKAYMAAEGMNGWNAHQGFYIYRGKRLLLAGNWLGMFKQEDPYKLVRIQVDIPNTQDSEWKIDIKKSQAYPPSGSRDVLEKWSFVVNRNNELILRVREMAHENPDKAIETLLRIIEEAIPTKAVYANQVEMEGTQKDAFEGFDLDALKSLAETLYETKINAGLSPEQARNEIKNIEPFNNFEELIDSL